MYLMNVGTELDVALLVLNESDLSIFIHCRYTSFFFFFSFCEHQHNKFLKLISSYNSWPKLYSCRGI